VLVDDRGPYLRDFGAIGEPIDDEVRRGRRCREGFVDDEVFPAGDLPEFSEAPGRVPRAFDPVSRAGAGCGTRRRPVAAALSGSTGTEQALVELTTLLRLELPVLRLVA
jgi:hypothetical protein